MPYNLLLIDDDQEMRLSLSDYLSTYNFKVSTAANIDAALNHLEQEVTDLIISDIIMDHGTGYELIKIIRKIPKLAHIPLIFLTAKGMTTDRIHGYNLGCNGYITKPFNPDELIALSKNILNNEQKSKKDPKNNQTQLVKNPIYNYCTRKEKAVLDLLLLGMTNKEIAEYLNINTRSVEKHVSKLLQKTSSRNRTELVKSFYTQQISNTWANDGSRTRE